MIAVTVGPGSFTGVRVGLAAARGLAVALAVPLAGITTTAALLAAAEPDDRLAVAAIDTHLGDWFCAYLPVTARHSSPRPKRWRRGSRGRACRIVGPQAEALAPLIAQRGRAAGLARSPACLPGWHRSTAPKAGATAIGPRACRGRSICAASTSPRPDGTRRTVE